MRTKIKGILSFFTLLFLTISPEWLLARHIIGGEITYEFISEVSPGRNRYRFAAAAADERCYCKARFGSSCSAISVD